MSDEQAPGNPFLMMVQPETVLDAVAKSRAVNTLPRRIYRPLDRLQARGPFREERDRHNPFAGVDGPTDEPEIIEPSVAQTPSSGPNEKPSRASMGEHAVATAVLNPGKPRLFLACIAYHISRTGVSLDGLWQRMPKLQKKWPNHGDFVDWCASPRTHTPYQHLLIDVYRALPDLPYGTKAAQPVAAPAPDNTQAVGTSLATSSTPGHSEQSLPAQSSTKKSHQKSALVSLVAAITRLAAPVNPDQMPAAAEQPPSPYDPKSVPETRQTAPDNTTASVATLTPELPAAFLEHINQERIRTGVSLDALWERSTSLQKRWPSHLKFTKWCRQSRSWGDDRQRLLDAYRALPDAPPRLAINEVVSPGLNGNVAPRSLEEALKSHNKRLADEISRTGVSLRKAWEGNPELQALYPYDVYRANALSDNSSRDFVFNFLLFYAFLPDRAPAPAKDM